VTLRASRDCGSLSDQLHAEFAMRMEFEGGLRSVVEGAQAAQRNEMAARMQIAVRWSNASVLAFLPPAG